MRHTCMCTKVQLESQVLLLPSGYLCSISFCSSNSSIGRFLYICTLGAAVMLYSQGLLCTYKLHAWLHCTVLWLTPYYSHCITQRHCWHSPSYQCFSSTSFYVLSCSKKSKYCLGMPEHSGRLSQSLCIADPGMLLQQKLRVCFSASIQDCPDQAQQPAKLVCLPAKLIIRGRSCCGIPLLDAICNGL